MNKKAEEVNNVLEKVCNQRQIGLINHSNINTTSRINRSKLHLNGYEKSLYGILKLFNERNLRDNTLSNSLSLTL